jgi:transposase
VSNPPEIPRVQGVIFKELQNMPRVPQLNREAERVNIWTLREQGLSWNKIVQKTGKDRKTVRRICKRVKESGSFKDKSRSGRPSKLSERDCRLIVGVLRKSPKKTAESVRKQVLVSHNIKVCRKTIAKVLKESGYVARVKREKPTLTTSQKKARFNWAKCHATWTIDEWRSVIWSDETAFMLVNDKGREYCWTKGGETLSDSEVIGSKKFGGGKVMIWGCITYEGMGFSCKIDDILDAELYSQIMREELNQTIRYYHLDPSKIIFQQDNDPKHTSKLAKDTLRELEFEVMEWPAQSPDLNPIENIWNHLKTTLRNNTRLFATKEELWEAIQHEMKNENKELCRKFISSMPQRVQALIRAKGGYIKF